MRWSPGFTPGVRGNDLGFGGLGFGGLGFGGLRQRSVPGAGRQQAAFSQVPAWLGQFMAAGPPGLLQRPVMGGGAAPPPLPAQAAPAPAGGGWPAQFYGIPTQAQMIAAGQAFNPTPTAMTTPSPYAPQVPAGQVPFVPPGLPGGRPPWIR